MRVLLAAAAAIAVCLAPAAAQTISGLTPSWARTLLLADQNAATGGRANLSGLEAPVAVRVTIAPADGGVARVVRFEGGAEGGALSLRRFTGHPVDGWWLWGPDTPTVSDLDAATGAEIASLAESAARLGRLGAAAPDVCRGGESAYVEIAGFGGGVITISRPCVRDDPVSLLATRLSDLAGSRTDRELIEAAQAELMDVDRAFNARAAEDGLAEAFSAFAGPGARMFTARGPVVGEAAIRAYFEDGPQDLTLTWAPEGAVVSTRGDLGYTWGRWTSRAGEGETVRGQYMTVWRRDFEGQWRFIGDLGAPVSDEEGR